MTRFLALFTGLLAPVSLATAHCGSDEEAQTSAAAPVAEGTYAGALIGDGFAGSVKLTIAAEATSTRSLRPLALLGPLTLTGTIESATIGVPVTVTGTYDPATQSVSFSGSSPKGEVRFRGKLENGAITGPPAETPFGPVPLLLVKELLGVRVFCGEITGAPAGLLGVITAGERAGAAYSVTGGPRDAIFGSVRGASLDVQGGGAKVLGEVSGATLTGTFTSPTGAGGSYVATEGRCATLAAGLLDGGGGGTDGGGGSTDAGPPKTPELVATVASPGVGHIALANGVLYYTVAHSYFSQKLEIGKVGTDGQNAATVVAVNVPPGETRPNASGLAVVGSTLYISGGTNPPGVTSTLLTAPSGGGALTTSVDMGEAAKFENYSNFAADSAGVYRADCAGVSSVRAFSLAGAPGGALTGLVGACAIATDGTNVFFGGGQLTGIQRVPNAIASGSAVATPVASADDYKFGAFVASIQSMTTDASHVYWVAANNAEQKGGVWRRAKDGSGATQTLTRTSKLVRGAVAVDDSYVYFFTVDAAGQGPSSATLQRIAKGANDGTPQPIGAANPYSVVTDGSYVYWGDGTSLRRVAK